MGRPVGLYIPIQAAMTKATRAHHETSSTYVRHPDSQIGTCQTNDLEGDLPRFVVQDKIRTTMTYVHMREDDDKRRG